MKNSSHSFQNPKYLSLAKDKERENSKKYSGNRMNILSHGPMMLYFISTNPFFFLVCELHRIQLGWVKSKELHKKKGGNTFFVLLTKINRFLGLYGECEKKTAPIQHLSKADGHRSLIDVMLGEYNG